MKQREVTPSDSYTVATYTAFVEAQKVHGAQSPEAIRALGEYQRAMSSYRSPPQIEQ